MVCVGPQCHRKKKMYIYIYIYVCVCVCVCIYIYIYIYIYNFLMYFIPARAAFPNTNVLYCSYVRFP